MTTLSNSLATSDTETIISVLGNIIDKMSLMFMNIESRLTNIEILNMRELPAIKESIDNLKNGSLTCPSFTNSDQVSQVGTNFLVPAPTFWSHSQQIIYLKSIESKTKRLFNCFGPYIGKLWSKL